MKVFFSVCSSESGGLMRVLRACKTSFVDHLHIVCRLSVFSRTSVRT